MITSWFYTKWFTISSAMLVIIMWTENDDPRWQRCWWGMRSQILSLISLFLATCMCVVGWKNFPLVHVPSSVSFLRFSFPFTRTHSLSPLSKYFKKALQNDDDKLYMTSWIVKMIFTLMLAKKTGKIFVSIHKWWLRFCWKIENDRDWEYVNMWSVKMKKMVWEDIHIRQCISQKSNIFTWNVNWKWKFVELLYLIRFTHVMWWWHTFNPRSTFSRVCYSISRIHATEMLSKSE